MMLTSSKKYILKFSESYYEIFPKKLQKYKVKEQNKLLIFNKLFIFRNGIENLERSVGRKDLKSIRIIN